MSTKIFILTILFILFVSESFIFYTFFQNSKQNLSSLVKDNIQVNILNLKNFLQKNLTHINIDNLTAYIDNTVFTNRLLQDVHIINNNKKQIYATDRDFTKSHLSKTKCIRIRNIAQTNVLKQACYSFDIKLYNGLQPYTYTALIFVNQEYLNTLYINQVRHFTLVFIIYVTVFILLLWYLLKSLYIIPLEKLRQYAYYSTKSPKKFFIQEFESIRYSLSLTFNRLKKEQDELYKLSTQDPLSGLYNRLSLIEKLNWLISKSKRSNEKFAVIFLDLDNFKNINDSRGHDFGDKILQHVSEVLLHVVRDNDIVSRLGGDEFVIVLPELVDDTRVIDIAKRIQEKLCEPIIIDNYKYVVTASMGITMYPKDGKDATTLLKNADIAMYKSKDLGKNNYHYFTDSLNELLQEKIHMESLMEDALEHGNFKLFYQPKVDIKTSKIIGCEALIRLVDPMEGIISPYRFIKLAEDNNFIIPLGNWIIQEATKQLKLWKGTELENVKISINMSSIQFKDTTLVDTIKNAIKEIDASKFDIELTESVFMSEFEKKIKVIKEIKELGISLSLDDFGTGYSSLSYLKTIPFNTIKIDKSFIDDIESSEREKVFINMIVNIADELSLDVVAEGVENEKQLEYLRSIKCEQYQGYLCSEPLPLHLFEELFKNKKCS
ncbi:putative bifunctional diguanylate cyclase/phosphodiesterase [Sulfurimonas sp.]